MCVWCVCVCARAPVRSESSHPRPVTQCRVSPRGHVTALSAHPGPPHGRDSDGHRDSDGSRAVRWLGATPGLPATTVNVRTQEAIELYSLYTPAQLEPRARPAPAMTGAGGTGGSAGTADRGCDRRCREVGGGTPTAPGPGTNPSRRHASRPSLRAARDAEAKRRASAPFGERTRSGNARSSWCRRDSLAQRLPKPSISEQTQHFGAQPSWQRQAGLASA